MPVTRIRQPRSTGRYRPAHPGGSRRSFSPLTGPASSTGSPITFMMRPSRPAPTGTEIGAPVSVTSWPRTSPSVVSMAMVRTVFSPSCCATSSTRRLPWLVVSRALRIAGRSSSKCTSTTAPMTWVMCPLFAIMALFEIKTYSASAPEMISISSLVIIAWRVRL